IVLGRRWHLSSGLARYSYASHPQLLDGFIQLFGGHLRMLQGNRCQSNEPIRMRIAPGGEPFILHLDDLPGQVRVCFIPPTALMAEHLNIDSLLAHELQARGTENERAIAAAIPRE